MHVIRVILLNIFLLVECNILAQNPIAIYKFDNEATDISGNHNNGKIFGGVSSSDDRYGNPCGALNFNGIDGYVEVPTSPSLENITNQFSATCWFKIHKTSQSNLNWLTLFCKGINNIEAQDNPQYRVQILQSLTQSTISINSEFTENDDNFKSHLFEYDKWCFYSLVYDGNIVKTFLNGKEIWSFPYNKLFIVNYQPLLIAKDIPGSTEFFCGALDDLKIYDKAISLHKILDEYIENRPLSIENEFELNCSIDIKKNTDLHICGAFANYTDPTIINNCGSQLILTQVEGYKSGSEFPIGSTTIGYKASGASNYASACYFNIIVTDNEPPIIKCNSDTTIVLNDAQKNGIVFKYNIPVASDNCSIKQIKLIQGLVSGNIFPIGVTNMQFEAIDESGNSARCSYQVIIKKAIEDSSTFFQCPKNIKKMNNPTKCGAIVDFEIPGIHNADTIKLLQNINQLSGSFFKVGDTDIMLKYSILSSLIKDCIFKITVIDNEKPTIICPNDTILYINNEQDSLQYSFAPPIAIDNCSINSISLISGRQSGEWYPLGRTINSFEATDINGNIATCSFMVEVKKEENDLGKLTEIRKIEDDTVNYQGVLLFNNCMLTIVMYDDGEEDNDTVSVYINNSLIVDHQMIKSKKNQTIIRVLKLNPNETNSLISKAWNKGKVGVNTLRIDFFEGDYSQNKSILNRKQPVSNKIIHSKPGVAGAIKLNCT
jgi:hypothetical protein